MLKLFVGVCGLEERESFLDVLVCEDKGCIEFSYKEKGFEIELNEVEGCLVFEDSEMEYNCVVLYKDVSLEEGLFECNEYGLCIKKIEECSGEFVEFDLDIVLDIWEEMGENVENLRGIKVYFCYEKNVIKIEK